MVPKETPFAAILNRPIKLKETEGCQSSGVHGTAILNRQKGLYISQIMTGLLGNVQDTQDSFQSNYGFICELCAGEFGDYTGH